MCPAVFEQNSKLQDSMSEAVTFNVRVLNSHISATKALFNVVFKITCIRSRQWNGLDFLCKSNGGVEVRVIAQAFQK
jgi:hypothetical protein